MPDINGLDVLKQVRETPPITETIVFIVSASASAQIKKECVRQGCNEFIAKPVELNELFKKIGFHLKLEWKYKKEPQSVSIDENIPTAIVPPSPEAIAELIKAANDYDYEHLDIQLNAVEESNPLYLPFVQEVRKLADEFRMSDIIEMLKSFSNQPNPGTPQASND